LREPGSNGGGEQEGDGAELQIVEPRRSELCGKKSVTSSAGVWLERPTGAAGRQIFASRECLESGRHYT
jgi:hypothetical protein